jgi:hypothetical protein
MAAALLALAVTTLVACDDDEGPARAVDPATSSDLEFTQPGGCGDAFFWATTADDEHAVVVTADLRNRSDTEPTELDTDLPDQSLEVEVWDGTELTSRMCNDIVLGRVDEKTPVTRGHVHITLQPRPDDAMKLVDGKAELTGLVTDAGTALPDLAIKTTSIGFYAG